jgi:hypothetical protein
MPQQVAPSREDRRRELQTELASPTGKQEVYRLFRACFTPGVVPPAGSPIIETILSHEFGEEKA